MGLKLVISDNFVRGVTVAAQITQTIAIVVAGFWALYVWTETVLPGAATGIQATGEVSSVWDDQANACLGTFRVALENVGIKKAKLGDVTFSVAPIPARRLRAGEKFHLLRFTLPTDTPVGGPMESLQGIYAPKEKRLKEIPFLFRPENDTNYSVEVIMAEGPTSAIANKWYAVVENCRAPQGKKK